MIIHMIVAEIASELDTDTVLALGVTVVVLWKAQKGKRIISYLHKIAVSISIAYGTCVSNSLTPG